MSSPQPPLQRSSLAWLLAVALTATLPHYLHQPLWLSAVTALVLLSVAWQGWRGYSVLNRGLKLLIVIVGTGGILIEYQTLLGRDAGVAILVFFMALKLLELKGRRDGMVVITLGYFLLLTHYFYSQSIFTGLWLLGSTLTVTGALVHLYSDQQHTIRANLLLAGRLLLQALPLMMVLYVLFPRVNGPLWGLPRDAHAGRTGLTNTMSPGNISNLAQSGEIAFRAQFQGPPPPTGQLYWRGPVLSIYDGKEWKEGLAGLQPSGFSTAGEPVHYTLTLEPHGQRWLLPLEMPQLPVGASTPNSPLRMDSNGLVFSRTPVNTRRRVEFTSYPQYSLGANESPLFLRINLQLPANRNPRTVALGQQWRAEHPQPAERVQQALQHFRQENFVYTLQPPLLGPEPMDDFLFNTRRGFCEHYAAAFVVLMRAAGIPSRVVTGYQGGEINPIDGFLTVRQSDAHAWAEVWLEGQGWIRVDPTAAISPSRIERGISSALPAGEPLSGLVKVRIDWVRDLRNQWEAINNSWNQWVLGYTPERQKELLSRLGITEPDWRNLSLLLLICMGILMLTLTAWTFRPRRHQDPVLALWQAAIRRLEKRGLDCPAWESPLALAQRLHYEAPELAPAVLHLAKLVTAARYGTKAPKMEALRDALKQLP